MEIIESINEAFINETYPSFIHISDLQTEWIMTLEVYIKLQLRRQANPSLGKQPLKTNLTKIILQKNLPKEDELLESLFNDSIKFLRDKMWSTEEYVTISELIRNQVIENSSQIFQEIKVLHLTPNN